MSGPGVSVVIPNYNGARFLPDAIVSVRAQTRPPDEILVVDDASTDDSVAVARALGATVVEQRPNAGPSRARNLGLERAAGDLVAFLDADDAWLPWHLELCVGALERHPRAAVACTAAWPMERPAPARPAEAPVEVPGDATVALLREAFVPQSAAVVRRAVALGAGGYDARLRHAEDFDLWLRLAADHAVARVRAPGLLRRAHPGQASRAQLRMVESAYALLAREAARVAASGDAGRAARAGEALAARADDDLRALWHVDDGPAFDHVMRAVAAWPAAAAVRRRWARRRALLWRPRQVAKRVRDGVRARLARSR